MFSGVRSDWKSHCGLTFMTEGPLCGNWERLKYRPNCQVTRDSRGNIISVWMIYRLMFVLSPQYLSCHWVHRCCDVITTIWILDWMLNWTHWLMISFETASPFRQHLFWLQVKRWRFGLTNSAVGKFCIMDFISGY